VNPIPPASPTPESVDSTVEGCGKTAARASIADRDTLADGGAPVTLARIAQTWWPLALSWLLMSVEGPAHSAVVARLANPQINLAAWGGIVFPLALIIESPAVMLLSASTALSRNWETFKKLRRIAMILGATFTLVHLAIAFTPLYDFIARELIGAPEEILEPGRIGLMIMTPWTWAIAYRRFLQGAMIRFGHSRAVGAGTVVRIMANGLVLLGGYLIGTIPGIIVASCAVAAGVVAEAVYAGLRIRPIVRTQIRLAPRSTTPLTAGTFLSFYLPLALTSLLSFFVSPIGSAAMSRMPLALGSLAAWPVVSGLLFMLRSPGMAFNEVVVAMLDEPRSYPILRRFAAILGVGSFLLAAGVVATPLANLWLVKVMALPPELVELSRVALLLALPLPLWVVFYSWFQGIIVNNKRTRAVTESVVLYLALSTTLMVIGVATQRFTGIYVAIVAMQCAALAQLGWLAWRSREMRAGKRDEDLGIGKE
jgi:hypothetical protein